MEEKTFHENQKILIDRLLNEFMQKNESLYYSSTDEVCESLCEYIQKVANLNQNERELIQGLTPEEIKILFSYHSKNLL
jgi:hypothetical protein